MAYTDVISTENFPKALDGGGERSVYEPQEPESQFPPNSPAAKLEDWSQRDNLTDEFDDEKLLEIGRDAVRDYGIDENSRDAWKTDMDKALDMALQVTKDNKSYPWQGAANVNYPLVTTAALQFNARAYAAMIDGPNIVKAKVNGRDEGVQAIDPRTGQPAVRMGEGGEPEPVWQIEPGAKHQRAERVSRHMSWQLLDQMEEWEEETDRELIQVPIVGCAFRKTYRDFALGRNVSKLIPAMDLVVNDETTKSLETCPRITELCRYYRHQIETNFRKKLWREIEIEYDSEDSQKTELFLEQVTLLDLDEDDYPEPYIITVHHDTQQVVRIAACFEPEGIEADEKGEILRIEKVHYYTKIPFLPHPKGRFYDLGFGFLLKHLNHTINSTLNMLLDAGHLANLPSGWIGRGREMRAGHMRFRPGEMKLINVPGGVLRDALVMNDFKGPNVVLFQLMGYLVDAAQQVTSVQDVMTGDTDPQTQPTTLLARIEQGMKQMVTIFKRIHRARKKEYQKLYRLNRLYMDQEEYFTFQDDQEHATPDDYGGDDLDISPASDPTMVSDMQKLARAQAMFQWSRSSPFANIAEADKRYLTVLGVEDPEALLQEPGPDPQLMLEMAKLKLEHAKMSISASDAAIKRSKELPEILEILARAEKAASDAEATMAGIQLQDIQTFRDLIMGVHQMDMEMMNALGQGQSAGDGGGVQPMAGQPGNADSASVLPGLREAAGGGLAAMGGGPGGGITGA